MKRLLLLIPAALFMTGCVTTGSSVDSGKTIKPSKADEVRQQTVENIARMQRNMRNRGEYYPTGSPDDFHLYFLGEDKKVYRVKRDDWEVIPTEDSFPTVLQQLDSDQRHKVQKARTDSKRPRRGKERGR